jgi:hypothetical protein
MCLWCSWGQFAKQEIAPAVQVLPQDATGIFKGSYLLDFLNLAELHSDPAPTIIGAGVPS